MRTIKEIARAAGVSVTTVSNVINGNLKHVSDEKVRLIRDLIRRSGYIPNQAARSLAQRESRFVAIIIQGGEDENAFLNPYNAAYVGALTMRLYEYGYYPLIRVTDDFKTIEADIRGWNVAGVLFNGSFNRHLRNINSLPPIPSVFTDCYFDLPGVNRVGLDDDAAGRMAGDYLAGMGHRRIGFFASILPDSDVDRHRLEGLRQGLEKRGLSIPDAWVIPNADMELEYDHVAAILRDPQGPTAFFCSADKLAIILTHVANTLGLRVPEDISVLGFDDLPIASLVTPRLTTIAQDLDQKASLTVGMLVRHIDDKSLPPERVTLDVHVVERDSVARLAE
ncbi:MAG: LacI family DNA-binding transcriptional regulator [Clostridia bacterium]|nr:LacI family DNA-binding transcriptional regulator [Clostridia bacterium]